MKTILLLIIGCCWTILATAQHNFSTLESALRAPKDSVKTLALFYDQDDWGTIDSRLFNTLRRFRNLEKLHLSGTAFAEIPPVVFQLHQLQELTVRLTRVETLPKKICRLKNLRFLNLEGNQLTSLPCQIQHLQQLQHLLLQQNKITQLPQQLYQLSQLEVLNLWYNQLEALSEEVQQLQQLKTLVLADNQLTSLPESLLKLPQLALLDLRNNASLELPTAWDKASFKLLR